MNRKPPLQNPGFKWWEHVTRLNSDFFIQDPQSEAVTESEAAADALGETLYNIGLEDLYDREDALDDEGHWIVRFTLKPEEMQDYV